MQNTLTIEGLDGKQKLSGRISVHGSKNAALQALALPLIFADEVSFSNVPEIEDIRRMIELLRSLGARVAHLGRGSYTIEAREKMKTRLPAEVTKKIRASILATGPLLARFGNVSFGHPGGDKIGARPIDLFLEGFEKMGARKTQKGETYSFSKKGPLKGAEIFLKTQSVTVTQTLMIAAVLAKGTTVIKNAAMEPEIPHLADFLNSCGAKISGAGTTTITVRGTGLLYAKGKTYRVLPDRLETGTFLILAVLAGKDVTITNCEPKHIEALTEIIHSIASTKLEIGTSTIRVRNTRPLLLRAIDVKTHEYPGFITDFQPPFVVLLSQARGTSLVFETIFEGRFMYVGNLIQMGAEISIYDPHRIVVKGKTPLSGLTLVGPDIRAGLGYVLAAIIAKGTSVIHNVYCIDRGYEKIEERLAKLGLGVRRN